MITWLGIVNVFQEDSNTLFLADDVLSGLDDYSDLSLTSRPYNAFVLK